MERGERERKAGKRESGRQERREGRRGETIEVVAGPRLRWREAMEDLRPFGRRPPDGLWFPLCARVVLALLATGKHGFAASAHGRA